MDEREMAAVDPYGFAMSKIVEGLRAGEANPGGMSAGEWEILQAVRELIEARDPMSLGGI